VDVYVFGRVVYSERASDPSKIPKWFRDPKFADASRAGGGGGGGGGGSVAPTSPLHQNRAAAVHPADGDLV